MNVGNTDGVSTHRTSAFGRLLPDVVPGTGRSAVPAQDGRSPADIDPMRSAMSVRFGAAE